MERPKRARRPACGDSAASELRQNEVEREATQLERKALLVGIGEGMKLGVGEAGREARPDKKNLHSRKLIRAIETPQIASP